MTVAEKIKNKRQNLGLTQKEFAYVLGLGRYGNRTVRRWENGENKPTNLTLKQVLNFPETPIFTPVKDDYEFTFIDLFAGIGGIRLPFQKKLGKCVFTSEWDKFAKKTYRVNFGEEPKGDITEIKTDTIPNHNLLLAGFPCQPFSQAGLKKGFKDTRGTLFFDIQRIIQELRPEAFLLENVKRLKTHNKGNTLKVIKQNLKELNYTFDYKVLRAADFGLPQNRERLFMVGFNKNKIKNPEEYVFDFPSPPKSKTKVGSILENDVSEKYDNKYTISDKLWSGHKRRKREHQRKGNGFGYTLFSHDDEYTNTISARYYKDGSEILIEQGENKNPRKLTPREAARLQGFPDEFVIPVSDTQAYKQFGNSVAVPVVSAIADNLVTELKKIL